jgi:hypothetical protein
VRQRARWNHEKVNIMTTIPMEKSAYAQLSYEHIDHSIHALDLEELHEEQSLLGGFAQSDRIARVLKVYASVRPLLSTLSVVPLIPPAWRAGIVLFIQTLDALAASTADGTVTIPEKPTTSKEEVKAGEEEGDFKAGKDLSKPNRSSGRKGRLMFRPIRKVARDARTGGFISREEARRRPATTVVQTIKYPPRPAGRKR